MNNDWFVLRDKCPACNSTNLKNIYESEYNQPPIRNYLERFYGPQGGVDFDSLQDALYCLCVCTDCDLIFQREIPNKILMEKLYETWIDPKRALATHKNNKVLNSYYNHSYELTHIISYLNKNPIELKFLDFGMGWGDWALMAKAFGCQSFGMEISPERIRYAKSNGVEVLDRNTVSQHQFDFINTEQVFEHLANPFETLCELKKVLKVNGILKISVPKSKKIDRKIEQIDWSNCVVSVNAIAPLEHINCFRKLSLLNMAKRAKMKEFLLPINNYYQPKKLLRNTLKDMFHTKRRRYLNRNNYLFFQNDV